MTVAHFPIWLEIGTLRHRDLLARLRDKGVSLNDSAERLLASNEAHFQQRDAFWVVTRTVVELGLKDGASLTTVLRRAAELNLALCPLATGPYLRLAYVTQPNAPDSVLSNGTAPSGSLTVASRPLSEDDDFPKGFYLRVIDGAPWLRGYRASDEYRWSPLDCLIFRDNTLAPPR